MVNVGSFDAWLANARPAAYFSNREYSNNTAVLGSFSRPAIPMVIPGANSAPSSFVPHLYSPVASPYEPASSDSGSTGPRLSLLTAQLRDIHDAQCCVEIEMSGCDSGKERRCSDLALARAMSQPDYPQGCSWAMPELDVLSSPLQYGILTMPGNEDQPVPDTKAELIGAVVGSIDNAEDSNTLESLVIQALGDAAASAPSTDCWPYVKLPRVDLEPAAGPSARPRGDPVGNRTSEKRNMYDGTVRGGQPRKAGWCGGHELREPHRGPGAVGREGHLSLAQKTRSSMVAKPQLSGKPQLLSDMLRNALKKE